MTEDVFDLLTADMLLNSHTVWNWERQLLVATNRGFSPSLFRYYRLKYINRKESKLEIALIAYITSPNANLPKKESLLNLGPQFCIPSSRNAELETYIGFEALYQQMKGGGSTMEENVISGLVDVCTNYTKKKITFKRISGNDQRVMKNLKADPNIIITKPDKGVGVVLLDKPTYIEGVIEVLKDSSKFRKMNQPLANYRPLPRQRANNLLISKLRK